jgi:hypothetical protein
MGEESHKLQAVSHTFCVSLMFHSQVKWTHFLNILSNIHVSKERGRKYFSEAQKKYNLACLNSLQSTGARFLTYKYPSFLRDFSGTLTVS